MPNYKTRKAPAAHSAETEPLLSIELIPGPMWSLNARGVTSPDTWNELRIRCGAGHELSNEKRTCSICARPVRKLELHEVWRYDDRNLIQRLVNLIPICSLCHLTKHFGNANRLGQGAKALKHLMSVNGWSFDRAERYVGFAFHEWEGRSTNLYELDLNILHQYLPASKIHVSWLNDRITWPRSKLDASIWASEILGRGALILDTETTGLLNKNPVTEVIELAAINSRNRIIYQSLFRPLFPIPQHTVQYHGITNRSVKSAPSFPSELEKIRKALDGKIVVSYNANFDRRVIANTCNMYGVEPPDCRWTCAMQAYKAFSESRVYLKLPNGIHRALGDAKATLSLIKIMAKLDPGEI